MFYKNNKEKLLLNHLSLKLREEIKGSFLNLLKKYRSQVEKEICQEKLDKMLLKSRFFKNEE